MYFIYGLLDHRGVFSLLLLHHLPDSGFQTCVSAGFTTTFTICWILVGGSFLFATLFTNYWFLVGCFLSFHHTTCQLLVFSGVFPLFLRLYLPFPGFKWGVSAVSATLYTYHWISKVYLSYSPPSIYQQVTLFSLLCFTKRDYTIFKHLHIPVTEIKRPDSACHRLRSPNIHYFKSNPCFFTNSFIYILVCFSSI